MDMIPSVFRHSSQMTNLRLITYLGIVLIVVFLLLSTLRVAFRADLRKVPGPVVARFSGLYRLSLVYSGKAPLEYRKVHGKYGPIIRVGPNHVSIADPAAVPQIYGIGSNYLKSNFYVVFSPYYKDKPMESLFSTRDPSYHKNLKKPVAQLFSMTNTRNYEDYADECTKIFIDAMTDLQGQSVDLSVWLQWYAFDVIALITFQRKFGFMEQRRDVDHMIKNLEFALQYAKLVGQFPFLHRWLVGNKTFMRTLERLCGELPDPLSRFVEITEDEIARYDSEEKGAGRTDFLAQLRAKEAKDGQIPYRDMVNHLSNNILAGSDTTAISLRACFYYLMKTPAAYAKLVSEIDNADKNHQLSTFVTYEECLKLPYLQAVMKEALRIHPGVAFPLERYVPPEGATICDLELSGGTNISMNAAVIHMNKDVFGDDTDQFRPERWVEASPEQLKYMDRSFMAFGYGARTCIGKNISILEMGKFIPQIFRYFDLEWASPDPEWKTDAAWFWKQSGVIVKFKPRRTSL
ncbi:uncharacterized protein Z518_03346 [Rhinocladiella mackenziei CBS 650.93]|uniref:Cytochrome P450 oxidoreductase n=1 Tax=Rhinocladiella mackenziei CBS 650.93 TaxID=1442369 RepID=A0A0D2IRR9_9EURO|nr:uncharacterized protein Z518_03346 [Rhinocladiella mackenziei CBS 650.93]KIX08689.1 hypothetical protein Z518_03346 [Rhinocladiella mackenziei CBS 650.93]